MEKYLLNAIQEKRPIGNITFNKNDSQIKISLEKQFREKYDNLFVLLISRIKQDGNFKIDIGKELELKNATGDFLEALVQSLLKDLNIIPEKIKIPR